MHEPNNAGNCHMFDTVQTKQELAGKLSLNCFNTKGEQHVCFDRTFACASNMDIDINSAEVFKLFRGRLFDRQGYPGAITH